MQTVPLADLIFLRWDPRRRITRWIEVCWKMETSLKSSWRMKVRLPDIYFSCNTCTSSGTKGAGQGSPASIWEDNWEDFGKEEDFSEQLRYLVNLS